MARPKSTSATRTSMLTVRLPPAARIAADTLAEYHGLSMGKLIEKAIHSMWNSQDWEIKWKDPKVHTEAYDCGYDVIREVVNCEPWLRSLKLSLMAPRCISAPEQRFWDGVVAEGKYFTSPDLNAIPSQEQLRYRPVLTNFGLPDEKALQQLYEDFLKKEEAKAVSE